MTPDEKLMNERLMDGGLRAYKWLLVLAGAGSLALGAWAEHRFFMHLPMAQRHALRLTGDVMLLLLVLLVFAIILRYEKRLAALNADLQAHNRALEELETTVDKRLIELAQNVALSLVAITSHARFAEQNTTDLAAIKAFSQIMDEAERMSGVTRELIALKQLEAAPPETKEEAPCES